MCVRDTISVRFNGEAECFPSCSYLCVASIHLRAHTHTRTYKTNPYLLPFLITLVCIQGKVGATFSCFSSQVNTHSGRFERLTRTFSWANWKPRAWNLQRFALGHASPSQHGPLITAEGERLWGHKRGKKGNNSWNAVWCQGRCTISPPLFFFQVRRKVSPNFLFVSKVYHLTVNIAISKTNN